MSYFRAKEVNQMNIGELICCLAAKICHARGELVNISELAVNLKFTKFTSSPARGLLGGMAHAAG